jgi:low affinity Fe/Cu permease
VLDSPAKDPRANKYFHLFAGQLRRGASDDDASAPQNEKIVMLINAFATHFPPFHGSTLHWSSRVFPMTFGNFSQALANKSGSPRTFASAIALIVIWAATGPYFHYNDTWQLIINTSTTIITFLMVFLIQNTQNRDNDILHIKIDELLRATKEAQNAALNLDDLDEKALKTIRKEYRKVGENETIEVSESETRLE